MQLDNSRFSTGEQNCQKATTSNRSAFRHWWRGLHSQERDAGRRVSTYERMSGRVGTQECDHQTRPGHALGNLDSCKSETDVATERSWNSSQLPDKDLETVSRGAIPRSAGSPHETSKPGHPEPPRKPRNVSEGRALNLPIKERLQRAMKTDHHHLCNRVTWLILHDTICFSLWRRPRSWTTATRPCDMKPCLTNSGQPCSKRARRRGNWPPRSARRAPS